MARTIMKTKRMSSPHAQKEVLHIMLTDVEEVVARLEKSPLPAPVLHLHLEALSC
jgi:hypothetical protein